MANSAAETNEKIEAKHKVTALQKAILKKRKQTADSNGSFFQAGCMIISRIFSIHPMFQKSGDQNGLGTSNYYCQHQVGADRTPLQCLTQKNGTPIAMCFASIFSFVFVALLAIAFSTDNWQNIAFKTPVQTEVNVSIFHSPIYFELRQPF